MSNIERPGDGYPPSRPGLKTFLGALVVILAGLVIAFWPQILGAMGIHVAPPGGVVRIWAGLGSSSRVSCRIRC